MYFLYVDGSGQTKIRRNSQDSGLYILSGVLVHERDKKSIVERIDNMKRELLPMFCPNE